MKFIRHCTRYFNDFMSSTNNQVIAIDQWIFAMNEWEEKLQIS